jgi:hypothetical protein
MVFIATFNNISVIMHITDQYTFINSVIVNNVSGRHFTTNINVIGGVMVDLLASSTMDR